METFHDELPETTALRTFAHECARVEEIDVRADEIMHQLNSNGEIGKLDRFAYESVKVVLDEQRDRFITDTTILH